MVEIKAYVRESLVDDVIDELGKLQGVSGVAVVPVRAFGHSLSDGVFKPVRMVKLEVDVGDEAEQAVVDCIVRNARTGKGHPGDGRVFVNRLRRVVRVRDGGEEDPA